MTPHFLLTVAVLFGVGGLFLVSPLMMMGGGVFAVGTLFATA